MNPNPLQPAVRSFALAAFLVALPMAVRAQSSTPATPTDPGVTAPSSRIAQNVSGKVTAKSDTSITVGDRTVSINSATTYTRNGASIGSGDVKAGDMVNIVTTD